MASNTMKAQAMNSIQVAEKTKYEGRGIIVCVDFEREEDVDDAIEVADEVAKALTYDLTARQAAEIADKLNDDRLDPIIKSLRHACTKNITEIEDADFHGSLMAVTAAVIIADYQDKLTQAQQRSETLEIMLNHQDAQAKGKAL